MSTSWSSSLSSSTWYNEFAHIVHVQLNTFALTLANKWSHVIKRLGHLIYNVINMWAYECE
jgi:hypothetical protein